MKISYEIELSNFNFWSGAKDNAEMLTDAQLNQIGDILEDAYPEGLNKTYINDLFWFDFEYVCSLIGLEYDPETDEIKTNSGYERRNIEENNKKINTKHRKTLKESYGNTKSWKRKGYTLTIVEDFEYGYIRFREMMKNYGGEFTDYGFSVPEIVTMYNVKPGDFIIGSYGDDSLNFLQTSEDDFEDEIYIGRRFSNRYESYVVKSTGGTAEDLSKTLSNIDDESTASYITATLTDLDDKVIDSLSGIYVDSDVNELTLEEIVKNLIDIGFDFAEAEEIFTGKKLESRKSKVMREAFNKETISNQSKTIEEVDDKAKSIMKPVYANAMRNFKKTDKVRQDHINTSINSACKKPEPEQTVLRLTDAQKKIYLSESLFEEVK